ncbi:MAG TPA: 4-hydroxybenzoate octaprenyltransferase, partial [Chromatiales bacterium]|nr:4-hydroxybenzoate octaprenyltransferase [Chromatiales bacterium]
MIDRERLRERGAEYLRLMRFDRPIGTLLLLWPTLWALWIAGTGRPRPGLVVIFVLGVVVMRAAGCIINDYADRDFDPHVRRTRERPLAAGRVTVREAMTLFALLCAVAFLLVLLTNRLTILLSFVGLLLAASYPFMKRYTYL